MKKGKERKELEEEWKEFFRDKGIKEREEEKIEYGEIEKKDKGLFQNLKKENWKNIERSRYNK